MKKSTCITSLLVAILVSSILLCIVWNWNAKKEGFADDISKSQTDYQALQTRLRTAMADYCDISTYVQAQMKEIYMAPKPADVGPTESEADAIAHVNKTYADVYACRDDEASSRQTCSVPLSTESDIVPGFVPCSTYTIPDWTDPTAAAAALSDIPDNLADRISREVDWYSQTITKLESALAMGASPPASVPDSPNSPATNAAGKPWSTEGFTSCSSAQIAERKRAAAAKSCTPPLIGPEIARVNALLDSSSLQATLSKCPDLKKAMVKLKGDQQKAKDGTLYDWQKAPPKKSYKTYSTANRSDSLVGSIQQNR